MKARKEPMNSKLGRGKVSVRLPENELEGAVRSGVDTSEHSAS